MRILSQDGMIDVPYEQCVFSMFFNEICSEKYEIDAIFSNNKIYKMAEYTTEEKAMRAMERLHEYEEYGLFQFPNDSELEV